MWGCGLISSLALAAVGVADEKGIAWEKSFDEALAKAKQAKKLVMVDFTADWCVWCKRLDQDTYSDAKVAAELRKNFVSVKVDVETEAGKKPAQKYGVTGLPTILFLDGDGGVQTRVTGFKQAGPFLVSLETAVKAYSELPKLLEALKAKPGDGKSAAQVIAIYAGQAKAEQAVKTLEAAVKAGAEAKDLVQAYNAVGDIYQERGKFPQAIKHFEQAAEAGAGKDKIYSLSSIAACHFSTGKFKEALAMAEKALAVEGVEDAAKAETIALVKTIKTELESADRSERLMGWCKDLDEALAKAKSANKLVMVDFYTDWCGWCKELDKQVYANEAAAQAISEVAVSLKIDAESPAGAPLAKKYEVAGYPTILFLDAEGAVAGKIGGFQPADAFSKTVKRIAADYKALPGLLAEWKADKTKASTANRLVEIYASQGKLAKAEEVVADAEKAGVKAGSLSGANLALVDAMMQTLDPQNGAQVVAKAQKLLKKTIDSAAGADKAKAQFMLAMTKLQSGDLKAGKADLESVAASDDLPAEMKKQAKQIIERLSKDQSGEPAGDGK
jgi:thiol-disulfide isomerase/thioredoxin